MAAFGFFEKDTFSLHITWHLADGSPKDLTGADVLARAHGLAGTYDLAAAVADAPVGGVVVTAAQGTFPRGAYELQVSVTVAGRTRTARYSLPVDRSL